MKSVRCWQGVRMRRLEAEADDDAPLRSLMMPAAWEDSAGAAIASLIPGTGPVHFASAAEVWIRPIAEKAKNCGLPSLGDTLHLLLRRRQGAPSPGIWRGAPEPVPGFVLNLASFHDAATGFDLAEFESAIDTAVATLTLAVPSASAISVAMADLAGLLACLGIGYDSVAARDLAACLAALLRARADAASVWLAGLFGVAQTDPSDASPPPALCIIPGLAALAGSAWAERPRHGLRHTSTTAILDPGPTDALLGIETGGIAPAFSPLSASGVLTRTARAQLAARGLGAEAALAAQLAGMDHFPQVPRAAHLAMRAVVAAYIPQLPALFEAVESPKLLAAPEIPVSESKALKATKRELPARSRGYAQRAAIGGHAVLLRTGEYEDGTLGEILIAPQKEAPSFRGLIECFAQAVSIGLQHGVGLEEYVDAFTLTRFGAAGPVEGDPAVSRATSILDYVFRNLAVNYLGREDVPQQFEEALEPNPATPLLPLDLPQDARPRRARLRLVGK